MKTLVFLSFLFAFSSTEAALSWIKGSFEKIPENAIFVGYETITKDIEIYVGRFNHNVEGWIVAKIVRWSDNAVNCYYSYLQKEHICRDFDILTGSLSDYTWIEANNGNIPEGGIRTNDRFGGFGIGRGQVGDRLAIGKIVTVDSVMYTPFYGEKKLATYEALVEFKTKLSGLNWVRGPLKVIPENAILAGNNSNSRAYVGRIKHPIDGWKTATILHWFEKNDITCSYAYATKEIDCQNNFDILTGIPSDYTWFREINGFQPECVYEANTYFGIGRGVINGEVVVGRVHLPDRYFYPPHGGKEYRIAAGNYEIFLNL